MFAMSPKIVSEDYEISFLTIQWILTSNITNTRHTRIHEHKRKEEDAKIEKKKTKKLRIS